MPYDFVIIIQLLLKGQVLHADIRYLFLKEQSLEVHCPMDMQAPHLRNASRRGLASGHCATLTLKDSSMLCFGDCKASCNHSSITSCTSRARASCPASPPRHMVFAGYKTHPTAP